MLSVATVNSASDSDSYDSVLTLREAILFTDGTLGYGSLSPAEQAQVDLTQPLGTNDSIKFNIPGSGLKSIELQSVLPTITKAVAIDGYSQPGSAAATDSAPATINVRVDGFNIDGQSSNVGLNIAAKNVTVRGLNIIGFSGSGIDLGTFSGNDTIAGNYIGWTTDYTPDNAANGFGITVAQSSNNTIGGTTAAERNVISGNNGAGVLLDVGSSGNTLEGNYIGTLADGSTALANLTGVGVSQSTGNTIGGTSAGARNIISGNTQYGIDFTTNGDGVSGSVVEGNYIGTDVAGNTAVKNGRGGVHIAGTSTQYTQSSLVTIGGTAAGAANLISGNGGNGVFIDGHLANGNTVQGNYIGTNAAGTAALGNNSNGVEVSDSDNNLIGGTDAGAGNIIAANSEGVVLDASNSNKIFGNFIGVLADGKTAAGNKYSGVDMFRNSGNNLVGADIATSANIIAYNETGVQIGSIGNLVPTINTVRLNSIFSNTGLGIDLADFSGAPITGVTPNDDGDGDTGSNDLQNFPLITSASATASTVSIGGQFNSTPSTNFLLDFYASDALDASGYGEGKQYLGYQQVTTDATGNVSYGTNFSAAIGSNLYITATATAISGAGAGDTSEFSQGIKAAATTTPPPPPVAPSVSINDVSQNEGTGGTTAFTFTITRSGDLSSTSIVSVSTADGSAPNGATAGSDYTSQTGTLVAFAVNQGTATFTVNVTGDTAVENNETFNVNVTSINNANISDGQGLGTIVNDDVAPPPPVAPSVSINDVAKKEGNSGVTAITFTLTRTGDLSNASSVLISTADNTAKGSSDYAAQTNAQVTFAANQATATFTVNVNGDPTVEPDETFYVNVSAVTNASIADGQGVGTIINDDVAPPPPPVMGSLSGVAFNDNNANGQLDANEAKTGGKVVFLDANNNGKLDNGETSIITDSNGAFQFTGLAAGTYHVRRVFPNGYTYSTTLIDLMLTTGQAVNNLLIGSKATGKAPTKPCPCPCQPPKPATLTGTSFNDNNKNGKFDAGDVGTAGKTVFLDTNNNGKLDSGELSTTSGANGVFSFGNLSAGMYHVRRVFPTGFTYSTTLIDLTVTAGQTVAGLVIGSKVG